MAIRIVDAVLVTSLGAAAVTGARWTSDSFREAAPPARTGAVTVEHYRPDYSPCELAGPGAGGAAHVRFALGPGETLLGITCAKTFAVLESRVATEKWDDVVTAHAEDCLDLSKWLAKRTPSGPYALLWGLRIEGPGGEQFRIGWSQFEGSDLKFSDLLVRAGPSPACRISVETANGQPVPGALVAISPPTCPNGLMSAHATTGQDGSCLVSGLQSRRWSASLPMGIGPEGTKTSVIIERGMGSATLRSPLRGDWTFVECAVDVPFRGGSLLATGLQAVDGSPGSWPVSMFVGPGTGRHRTWTWMRPRSATAALPPALVKFQGFDPLRIENPGEPFVVECAPERLSIRPKADGR